MQRIQIAIVDDDILQRKLMETLLLEASKQLDLIVLTRHFDSSEAFLFALEDFPDLDLAFLDIQMQTINGMEAARKLRVHNQQLALVFVTAFAEYALEGYNVNALDYILKPISLEQIKRTLERLLTLQPHQPNFLLVESVGNHLKVNLQDILYIEAARHQTILYLNDQQLLINRNISSLKAELDESFVKCHRSYLVNLAHVNQLTKTSLIISNGDTIPISRRLDKQVQTDFVNFYKKGVFYE